MSTSMLVLSLMVWSPGPQIDQEVLRQQQVIQTLESRVAAQEQETEELWAALEEQSPPCTAEMTSLNPAGEALADGTGIVRLDVVTTVSSPPSRCLPSTLSVTATYLDADGNLVCSGTASDVAVVTGLTGYISLEFQPQNLVNSVHWVNQPRRTDRGFQRVACVSPDGLVDVTTLPAGLGSLWLRLSLFPDGGGLAVSDFRFALR